MKLTPKSQSSLRYDLLRAAINAQIALWNALRALEHTAGERENPTWADFVVELAIGCTASADELSDAQLTDALAERAHPPTKSFR